MCTEDEQRIQEDLHRLAGSLPHRGPNTESERAAAEYLLARFREYTHDADFEEFESIDSFYVLFAGYYSEYLLVAVLAQWFPWVAGVYGTLILIAYLAEFTGYRVISRILPRYQSQNVVARFLAERPKRQYVISAHYDSGRASPISTIANRSWFHWIHRAVVCAMVLVVAACFALGGRVFAETPFAQIALWTGVVVLVGAGAYLLYAELGSDYVRGALDNAAGVTVLLALARQLRAVPLAEADVWLVATGSKEGWLSGMLHHLQLHDFDRSSTRFINLDHIGAPLLRYQTGEGMLQRFASDPSMIQAAKDLAPEHGAQPYVHRGLPTDLLAPLTRGYMGLGIASTDTDGGQPHRHQESDTLARVDAGDIIRTVKFTTGLLLKLENGFTGASDSAPANTNAGGDSPH